MINQMQILIDTVKTMTDFPIIHDTKRIICNDGHIRDTLIVYVQLEFSRVYLNKRSSGNGLHFEARKLKAIKQDLARETKRQKEYSRREPQMRKLNLINGGNYDDEVYSINHPSIHFGDSF